MPAADQPVRDIRGQHPLVQAISGTFAIGHWTWKVSGLADFHCFYGTYLSHTSKGQVDDIEIPFYSVLGPDRILIHWCCSISDATYQVSIEGDQLRLRLIGGATDFAEIMSTESWTREPAAGS